MVYVTITDTEVEFGIAQQKCLIKAKQRIQLHTYLLCMFPKVKKDIIWEAQETYTKVVPKYWLPWFSKVCVDSFWKQKVCTRSKSGRLKHFPSIGPGSKNVGGHEATQNLPASHEKNPRRVFLQVYIKLLQLFLMVRSRLTHFAFNGFTAALISWGPQLANLWWMSISVSKRFLPYQ